MKRQITTSRGPRGATRYNGHSIHDIARAVRCDPSHVSRVLRGKTVAGWRIMLDIARTLDVALDTLVVFRLTRETTAETTGGKHAENEV